MKNAKALLIALISIVVSSLACSQVSRPAQLPTPTASVYATAISAGGAHACALLSNGKVKCWGANEAGRLGDGTLTNHSTPVEIPDLANVIAISAGGAHTCALLDSSEVKCWGDNQYGQLGDGTKAYKLTPVSVPNLRDVNFLSAGRRHTCAVLKDGRALCWGANINGNIGIGSASLSVKSPAEVKGLTTGLPAISAGNDFTCALTDNGNIKCWGENIYGQIGDNTTTNRKLPADVAALARDIRSVSTGFSTSCAVTKDERVLCWGWIGMEDYYTTPHEIKGLQSNITAVAVGGDHICGLTSNATVKCLGGNKYGQLGNGINNETYTAATVKGLDNVISITANYGYTCALTSTGEVFCWGQNESGQLGNGTNTNSSQPVQVAGLTE